LTPEQVKTLRDKWRTLNEVQIKEMIESLIAEVESANRMRSLLIWAVVINLFFTWCAAYCWVHRDQEPQTHLGILEEHR